LEKNERIERKTTKKNHHPAGFNIKYHILIRVFFAFQSHFYFSGETSRERKILHTKKNQPTIKHTEKIITTIKKFEPNPDEYGIK
jgi:hypothetical protein